MLATPKMTKQSIGCQNFMNQHCALKLISIDKQSVRNFWHKLKVSLFPSKSVWMNHWNQSKLVWYTYNVNFRSIVISAGSRFRFLEYCIKHMHTPTMYTKIDCGTKRSRAQRSTLANVNQLMPEHKSINDKTMPLNWFIDHPIIIALVRFLL